MLKPFYIKKKNINNRLVPPVSAADAGKLLGVDEEGNITLVEAGGGGGGFDIVDFGGAAIENDGDDVTVTGIYAAVSSLTMEKPVLLKNLSLIIGGNPINNLPIWVDYIKTTLQDGNNVYLLFGSVRNAKNNLNSVSLNIFHDDVVYWG